MEPLVSTIAAIPAASHVVKHLHLRSRLPRRAGDVTVCTHCSLDRLERLEAQTRCWSGVICAAVMVPCPCTPASIRNAVKRVRGLHAQVEDGAGPCRLDIVLVCHRRRRSSLLPCSNPWQYPINALRNVALRYAATELVLPLDVDLLPGLGIQEELWNHDVYAGYHRACTELRRAIVLPALQQVSPSRDPSPIRNEVHAGIHIVSAGKASVVKMWEEGTLRVFASHVYPLGHGQTETERWLSSVAMYQVQYKDGYEPYFLCARRLVPWYDERFTGYGRNKVIHAFHIASLDFRFWVHPDWFVVHVDHPLSAAWIATLGSDPNASQRLLHVKSMYDAAKSELVSRPTHTGICLSPGVCAWEVPPARFSRVLQSLPPYLWSKAAYKNLQEEKMGHWSCADKPPDTLMKSSSPEYIEALHDLRYHYGTSKLRPASGTWPLRSKLPRRSRDISLVTVATWDRLQRLSAQCRVWKGVICAAVFVSHNIDVEALKLDLINLHEEVEKAGKCRLDLILLESSPSERRTCCCQVRGVLPMCNCATKQYSSTELCPINALRNAALQLAITDLVLLLDVDLLPAASLNGCSEDEQQYRCLSRMAIEEKTAVVVPSFQFSWKKFITSSNIASTESKDLDLSDDEIISYPQGPSRNSEGEEDELQKRGRSLVSLRQQSAVISRAEKIAEQGVYAIRKGLGENWVCGFHVKHYPSGHGPTDFDRWRELSQTDTRSDVCCPVCRSYTVSYDEGFEPFVICSREAIPRFDERFRGYGYDKISFIHHLHLLRFRFKVLLHTYSLNIPHAKSSDWMKTFGPSADSIQHIRVKSLYQRFKRELKLKTGVSISLSSSGEFSSWDLRENMDKPMELRSIRDERRFRGLIYLGGRNSKPRVEGLKLGWQGIINPVSSRRYISSDPDPHGDSQSTSHQVETETSMVVERDEVSQPDNLPLPKHQVSQEEDAGTYSLGSTDTKVQKMGCYKLSLGLCAEWRDRWADGRRRTHHSPKLITRDFVALDGDGSPRQEEFEWDNTNWKLKGSAESLANCSVVKLLIKDGEVHAEDGEDGAHRLRVSMSAGSWSPQASRLAGITTGGIAVRSLLPLRAVREVMLRYMVRFPSSFQWAKGGALPGIWVHDLVQTTFGWRQAGRGQFSPVLTGAGLPEKVPPKNLPNMSMPFYFVAGRWHAIQITVSVADHGVIPELEEESDSETEVSEDLKEDTRSSTDGEGMTKRVPFPYTLDLESVKRGAVLEIEASVDFEPVSKVTYSPYQRRLPIESSFSRERGAPMGLMMSCYFGGKTQDWATPVDTHIDFCQFQVWTD